MDFIKLKPTNMKSFNSINKEDDSKYIKKQFFKNLIKISHSFLEKYLNFTNSQIEKERENMIQDFKFKRI